ncbi:hypothetical protein NP493_27g06010 [Ridgeia piscesae]|uniref:Uncharacterized protein n=1 Tax=Ridgeia piscesae TaxID=27915 RepID=A0AAD9PDG3_RIDPI|nr:hypothetical protein NP493_27g06010 [Ridgeia piscesae]
MKHVSLVNDVFSRHAELGELSHDCVELFCCFRRDGWLITYCRFGRFVRECTKHFLCLGSSNCQQDGNLLLVFRSVLSDSCQITFENAPGTFPTDQPGYHRLFSVHVVASVCPYFRFFYFKRQFLVPCIIKQHVYQLLP